MWTDLRRPLHLVQSISWIIARFSERPESVPARDRYSQWRIYVPLHPPSPQREARLGTRQRQVQSFHPPSPSERPDSVPARDRYSQWRIYVPLHPPSPSERPDSVPARDRCSQWRIYVLLHPPSPSVRPDCARQRQVQSVENLCSTPPSLPQREARLCPPETGAVSGESMFYSTLPPPA